MGPPSTLSVWPAAWKTPATAVTTTDATAPVARPRFQVTRPAVRSSVVSVVCVVVWWLRG